MKRSGSGKEAVVPVGITSIGKEAFEGRGRLMSVTIPDAVTSIASGAFLAA